MRFVEASEHKDSPESKRTFTLSRRTPFFSFMIVVFGHFRLSVRNFLLCLFIFWGADFKSGKSTHKRGPIQLDHEAISCAINRSPI
jgi:hypothetical protein